MSYRARRVLEIDCLLPWHMLRDGLAASTQVPALALHLLPSLINSALCWSTHPPTPRLRRTNSGPEPGWSFFSFFLNFKHLLCRGILFHSLLGIREVCSALFDAERYAPAGANKPGTCQSGRGRYDSH